MGGLTLMPFLWNLPKTSKVTYVGIFDLIYFLAKKK